MGLQQQLQAALDAAVASGPEMGLPAAVCHGEELVADGWSGVATVGVLDGVGPPSPERIDALLRCDSNEVDAVIANSNRCRLGFWLRGESPTGAVIGPNLGAFGHSGDGGAIAWCDPEARRAVALLKNRMLAAAMPAESPLIALADLIRSKSPHPGGAVAGRTTTKRGR